MFFRRKPAGRRAYLQLAETRRDGQRVRQRVIARFGRLDDPATRAQLMRLLRSGSRFADGLMMFKASHSDVPPQTYLRRIGPARVFEALWTDTDCRVVLRQLAPRADLFPGWERAIFATVLYRLVEGRDVPPVRWCREYGISGTRGMTASHIYKAVSWLGMPLAGEYQDGAPPFAPNCKKDLLENLLRRGPRESGLAVVLMDLAASHTAEQRSEEGGPEAKAPSQEAKARTPDPDFTSMVLALVIDADGRPLGWELWPGNIAKIRSPRPLIERLARRFGTGKVLVVAALDRLSPDIGAVVFRPRVPHLLAMRDRGDPVLQKLAGYLDYPFTSLEPEQDIRGRGYRTKDPRGERGIQRFRLYQNDARARADRMLREAAFKPWAETGPDKVPQAAEAVGQAPTPSAGPKITWDERLDGLFMLSTNDGLSRLEGLARYRQLETVEDAYGVAASLLDARRVFGNIDDIFRGHMCCSFLAIMLRNALETAIAKLGEYVPWPEIVADLRSMTEITIRQGDARWWVRSTPGPAAELAMRAIGLSPLPTLEPCPRPEEAPIVALWRS